MFFRYFLYSVKFWLNMLGSNRGCLCVCVCVCLSVCVSVCVISTAQTDGPIFMKLSTGDLEDICQWLFSRILKIQNGWRHGGHFVCFSFGHSHGRNFASIFFKIEHKVQSCLPMFAIENQQNRSVTSGNIENRVFEKNQNGRQK